MAKFLGVFVFNCFVLSLYAGPVSFITPCKFNDKKCLRTSSQAAFAAYTKGLSEYGIPAREPIFLEKGKSEEPGLLMKYKNVTIHGLGDGEITSLVRKLNKIEFVVQLPLKIKGQYELKGHMLLFDLVGNGNVDINTGKIIFNIALDTTTVKGSDGKDHWKVTGFDFSYDLVDKVIIGLTGLYNGDKEKAQVITQFFDTNWKEIVQEIGYPLIKQVIKQEIQNVNKIFSKVPCEDLEIV